MSTVTLWVVLSASKQSVKGSLAGSAWTVRRKKKRARRESMANAKQAPTHNPYFLSYVIHILTNPINVLLLHINSLPTPFRSTAPRPASLAAVSSPSLVNNDGGGGGGAQTPSRTTSTFLEPSSALHAAANCGAPRHRPSQHRHLSMKRG